MRRLNFQRPLEENGEKEPPTQGESEVHPNSALNCPLGNLPSACDLYKAIVLLIKPYELFGLNYGVINSFPKAHLHLSGQELTYRISQQRNKI